MGALCSFSLLDEPMTENMVFTVEPGIYLPDEGFGIRLEDDVVIQSIGEPINLMKDIGFDGNSEKYNNIIKRNNGNILHSIQDIIESEHNKYKKMYSFKEY